MGQVMSIYASIEWYSILAPIKTMKKLNRCSTEKRCMGKGKGQGAWLRMVNLN